MMNKRIDFYFDFSVPFAYFASTRINDLAAQYGHHVDWHPFVSEQFKPSNSGTGLSQIPVKLEYQKRDYVRTAQYLGIDYHPSNVMIKDARYASQAVIWAETKFGEGHGVQMAQAIFKAYYVDGQNIGDTQVLNLIGQTMGIDAQDLDTGISSASTREQFRAEIDLATAKGVFGAPFFVLDGEPFWGLDRMGQLEAALKRKTQA